MKKFIAVSFSLIMLISLAACGKDKTKEEKPDTEKEPENIEFPVEVGGAKIEASPSSVVSLSPSLTEIIFDLGYGNHLEGVSDFCDYPKDTENIDDVGTSSVIDFKKIKSISPKIVFTSFKISENDAIQLEQMGTQVVYLPPAKDIEELWGLYDNIGTAFEGKVTGPKNAKNIYSKKLEQLKVASQAVAEYIDDGGKKVSVAYVAKPKLTIATGDSLASSLLEYIGLENVASNYNDWKYPEGEFQNFKPDLLIYPEGFDKKVLGEYYKSTPALANGFLYTLEPVIFERQGFRMIDEVIGIAKYAYPKADFSQLGQNNSEPQETTEQTPEN